MVKLTLVTRAYCHLCDEMAAALRPIVAEFSCELDIVDVDADDELLQLYDELVPVLLHDEGQRIELCHYVLDVRAVRDYLSEIG